jgi:hypothetical protein
VWLRQASSVNKINNSRLYTLRTALTFADCITLTAPLKEFEKATQANPAPSSERMIGQPQIKCQEKIYQVQQRRKRA